MMKPLFLYSLMAWTLPALVIAVDNDSPKEQVLILDNERTIHGEIERLGNRYRIRRGGGATWMNADRVLAVCESREKAYLFLRDRSKLTNPDDRLRLARWCYLQKLYDHALNEIQEAVRLRPSHRESQELLRYFTSLAEQEKKKTRLVKKPEKEQPQTAPKPRTIALSVPLSTKALASFTSQVQPVLMNACAGCHARPKDPNPFQLHRVEFGRLIDNRFTQQNVLAVLSQVNARNVERSSVLQNAVRAHGTAKWAPLSGQKMVAYRKLEAWVKSTLEEHPELKSQLASKLPPLEAVPTLPELRPAPPKEKEPVGEPVSGFGVGVEVEPEPANSSARSVPRTEPKKLPGIRDEFDATIFNRQMHPDRENPDRSP